MGASVPRLPRTDRLFLLILTLACAAAGASSAQIPDEVPGAGFTDPTTLGWSPAADADFYNVYRGDLALLSKGVPGRCHGFQLGGLSFDTPATPEQGAGYFYLLTGESASGGEGSPGDDSDGFRRALLGSCSAVMRNHVQDRTGYGWDEWTRDRISTLGLAGYLQEQLNPATIDETDNDRLNDRLPLLTPPENIADLIAQQIVRGVYARRQLEQQAASFWSNHFNTFNLKVEMHLREWFPR